MFERAHHLRIALALQSLNAALLERHGCLFGGGTAIVLAHREYRESVDIDFLVSDLTGYRALRELLKADGLGGMTRPGATIEWTRDVRADQYGLRTMLLVGGAEIKFEIVFEARIQLEPPMPADRICGVATLSRTDMAATKLLANSDRWADDGIFSRDLIDLAMIDASNEQRREATEKARAAYGDAVERDLQRAIQRLGERAGRLDECMRALRIDRMPKAVLWSRIRRLRAGRKEG